MSFTQVDQSAGFFGLFGSKKKKTSSDSPAAKLKEREKITIRPDGCCNTCPSSVFESTVQRFEEPNGGPFGLRPRHTAGVELGKLTGDCDPYDLDTTGGMASTSPEPKP